MRANVGGLPVVHRATVLPDWIDYNGHFNAGYYAVVFDDAIGSWLSHCGLDRAHREQHQVTTFTAESHLLYLRELHESEELEVTGQLLAFSEKKIHSLLRMYVGEASSPAATYEVMSLHIDLEDRRPGAMHRQILQRLEEVKVQQGSRPWPPHVGRVISVAAQRPPEEGAPPEESSSFPLADSAP